MSEKNCLDIMNYFYIERQIVYLETTRLNTYQRQSKNSKTLKIREFFLVYFSNQNQNIKVRFVHLFTVISKNNAIVALIKN